MEQPPKLPRVAALTDVDFGQQHEELRKHLSALSTLAAKADPSGVVAAAQAQSCINNLFANLDARMQVLEQLAMWDGKYPTKYE